MNIANYLAKQKIIEKRNGGTREIWMFPNKKNILNRALYKAKTREYDQELERLTGTEVGKYSVEEFEKKLHEELDLIKAQQKFLNLYMTNENAIAYKKGVDFTKQLEELKTKKYFYKFDFKNFFNSFYIWVSGTYPAKEKRFYDEIPYQIIQDAFIPNSYVTRTLKQGHPNSPVITNIIMKKFDDQMTKWAETKSAIYKRYCDDIIIGSDVPHNPKFLECLIERTLKMQKLEFIKLNQEKTKAYKMGGNIKFLGISISKQNGISAGWRERKRVMQMVVKKRNKAKRLQWTAEEKGKVNWINHITKDETKKISMEKTYGK